ncbi:PP2C family protein-serine/threonine phosphatase [Streptomyces europaeiscabiei]|uniref:PP2C family protein-serine/threonine phosphatase n=1 Tax=Streptomyces europaeiscabiei TaxID=146819 RepID=A0AAJ2PLI9_9ACTN|nr:PP2C family protein-serine/threonine phosphatase [Streptomyces europaeiscabiei]MDX3129517.1 PP2C family protein-serine/threonine phosphatase [Streptomyces europaeiscabiei]
MWRALAGARVVGSAVFLAVGAGLLLHGRQVMLREVRQAREAAGAARSVLLPPLPTRIAGLATAAAQLSADRGARVGGDLYEVIATEHGVRVVMGDVRGHGHAAVGTVAAVLGSFREAVHDEAELSGVLARLDRALARHLRDRARAEDTEDFVTVLLLEIAPDGELHALNCGHPWPYLLGVGRAAPVTCADPMPPLGLFPLPAELPVTACGQLLPGEALFLHTDGVEDARDGQGRFFPLAGALEEAVRGGRPTSPRSVLRAVFTQLLRHAGGRPKDDIAILVLRNERPLTLRGARNASTSHGQPAADNPPLAPTP